MPMYITLVIQSYQFLGCLSNSVLSYILKTKEWFSQFLDIWLIKSFMYKMVSYLPLYLSEIMKSSGSCIIVPHSVNC